MDLSLLRGIYPPILTPLLPDESIDHTSLARLVNYLIDQGVHGIWVMGTTGEFASFDEREREAAVVTVVETVRGRVPVVANVGDASTRLAIRHARAARRAGADALALLPPYYYPSSQDELLAHFRAVRGAVDLPLLAYNIPQTVKTRIDVATILTLVQEGTICGWKDSQNDLDWFRQAVVGCRQRGVAAAGFLGTRILIDAGIAVGAAGAIPGIANVAPAACVATYEAAARGDFATAATHQERVMAATALAGTPRGGSPNAANLAAMKAALVHLGVIAHPTVTRPLRPLTAEESERVKALVAELRLAPAAAGA